MESGNISGLRRALNAVMGKVRAKAPDPDFHKRIIASGHISVEGGDQFAEGGVFNRIGECPTCAKRLMEALQTSDEFLMHISYYRNPTTGCVQLHVEKVEI